MPLSNLSPLPVTILSHEHFKHSSAASSVGKRCKLAHSSVYPVIKLICCHGADPPLLSQVPLRSSLSQQAAARPRLCGVHEQSATAVHSTGSQDNTSKCSKRGEWRRQHYSCAKHTTLAGRRRPLRFGRFRCKRPICRYGVELPVSCSLVCKGIKTLRARF